LRYRTWKRMLLSPNSCPQIDPEKEGGIG
jgi:hypothetical protein